MKTYTWTSTTLSSFFAQSWKDIDEKYVFQPVCLWYFDHNTSQTLMQDLERIVFTFGAEKEYYLKNTVKIAWMTNGSLRSELIRFVSLLSSFPLHPVWIFWSCLFAAAQLTEEICVSTSTTQLIGFHVGSLPKTSLHNVVVWKKIVVPSVFTLVCKERERDRVTATHIVIQFKIEACKDYRSLAEELDNENQWTF